MSVKLVRLQPATFDSWLFDHIFHATLADFLRPALIAAGVSFVCLFLLGAWLDRRRNNAAKSGRLIRGPRLVSRSVFNLRTWGTGLRFPLTNRRNPIETLMGERGRSLMSVESRSPPYPNRRRYRLREVNVVPRDPLSGGATGRHGDHLRSRSPIHPGVLPRQPRRHCSQSQRRPLPQLVHRRRSQR